MPALHRQVFNPYGREHRRARTALLRGAIGTRCPGTTVDGEPYRSPRCTQLMTDPRLMHAEHTIPVVHGGQRATVIICAPCNTGAGAILGNQRRTPEPRRRTRVW